MIKMVVSDVDGTLLQKGEKTVNDELMEIIEKLKSKNIIFAVASGRHLSELKDIFHNSKDIYYICSDGGCIEFGGDIIYYKDIDNYIIDNLKCREDYIFQCSKYTYYNGKNTHLLNILKNKYRDKLRLTDKISNIVKIIKYGAGYSETPPCTYEIYKDSNWREWIKNGTSKGNALSFLQSRLGVKVNETLVIGDNFNDLSMMRYAGEKLCMESSPPQVKLMCGRVCYKIEDELLKTGGSDLYHHPNVN